MQHSVRTAMTKIRELCVMNTSPELISMLLVCHCVFKSFFLAVYILHTIQFESTACVQNY